jgi:DUF1009 family protein
MLGAITKKRFFADAMLDVTGLRVLARVAIRSDDNLLRAFARFLEEEGIPITDPTPFLADRLAPEGVLGKHEPTPEELADARYGLELARGIGRLDLGQTVVVKDRVALAVEALEGTDACIRRGGELAKAGGFVVAKAVKPDQDRRFDLPAVGPDTLDVIREAGGRVLAIEAGATLDMELPADSQANRRGARKSRFRRRRVARRTPPSSRSLPGAQASPRRPPRGSGLGSFVRRLR